MPHIDHTNEIQQLFPYLIVRDAAAAIDFYKRVFGAEETMRLAEPSGRIGHAELKLGAAKFVGHKKAQKSTKKRNAKKFYAEARRFFYHDGTTGTTNILE